MTPAFKNLDGKVIASVIRDKRYYLYYDLLNQWPCLRYCVLIC